MDLNIQDFNIVPLNERYYGKTKDVLKIEKAIGEYRKKYLPKNKNDIFYKPKILKGCFTDPKLFDISKAIKDAFGFKAVSLKIEPHFGPNAYTQTILSAGSIEDPIDYSGEHPRFKKEAEMSCVIVMNTPLIFDPEQTDAEVTAWLLHEIGHNFQYDLLKDANRAKISYDILLTVKCVLQAYCDAMAVQTEFSPFPKTKQRITAAAIALVKTAVAICKGNTSHKKRNAEIEEFADKIANDTKFKQEEEKKAMDKAEKYRRSSKNKNANEDDKSGKLFTALMPAFAILASIASVEYIAVIFGEAAAGAIVSIAKNMIKSRLGLSLLTQNAKYNNEKIADSFAAELGYGPELTSSFIKGDRSDNEPGSKNYSQAINNIEKITWLPVKLLLTIFDAHAIENNRYELYYKELVNDLEKGYFDPEMKADLEKNIAAIKDYMDTAEKAKKLIDNTDDPEAERSVISGVIDLIVSSSLGFAAGVKEAISKITPHYFTTTPNISDSKEEARRRALDNSNYIDTSKLK